MKRALLALALLAGSCTSAPRDNRPLHDALFETFFHPESRELRAAGSSVRDASWPYFAGRGDLLDGFPADFVSMGVGQREDWIAQQLKSPVNEDRRRAASLRAMYLGAIYASPIGAAVSQTTPPVTVTPEPIAVPRFPRGRLVHDPSKGEIRAATGEVDIVIVGSGPAGSVLAHELRTSGRTVVLVEQGPFILPGAMETRVIPRLMDGSGWRTTADGGIHIRNGRAVGGGTTVNVDLAFSPTLPIIADRFAQWRKEGHVGADQYLPADVARANEWVTSKVGTRAAEEREINANNRVLWDGALSRGHRPALYDLNTFVESPSKITDKKCAVRGFLASAMTDANPLTLLPDARVERIVFDGNRARGVEIIFQEPWEANGVVADPHGLGIPPGTRAFLPAKTVILCAGSLGSPALLLKSGVKNPNVGRGLVIHPSSPIIGFFGRTIDALKGTPATVFVDSMAKEHGVFFEAMSGGPEYAAMMIPGNGQDVFEAVSSFRRLAGFGVMLIDTPQPDNRVVLDDQGRPEVRYRLDAADAERFRRGIAEGVRIMFAGGAEKVLLPTVEVPAFLKAGDADGANRLKFIPNSTVMSAAHLQGTCRMGSDPATSVVGPSHKVWGTDNLYVVDGSIFPTSVGANPMQAIYTIAKLFADRFER